MSTAGLAARAVELLGRVDGPVAIASPGCPDLASALAGQVTAARDGAMLAGAVVVLLGQPARPSERQALLSALRGRLAARGPLVLIDYNQPRAFWRRVLAFAALAATGSGPARARYPAARELAALGFTVERLELAHGERIQLVRARA